MECLNREEERRLRKRISNAIYGELETSGLTQQEIKARDTAPIAEAFKPARIQIYEKERGLESSKIVLLKSSPHLRVSVFSPSSQKNENWRIVVSYRKKMIQPGNGMDSIIVERFAERLGMKSADTREGFVKFNLEFSSIDDLKHHLFAHLKPENADLLNRDNQISMKR